ncbi:MAG TPA: hypothetical protein VI789_02090 [Dehalococcoidia bacterium]|nr:hypothetical protein [Dehalococcoidia bacterium]
MAKPSLGAQEILGLAVLAALMALEIIEYFIGIRISPGALPLLILLTVPGAGVIIWFFMHLPQLWGGEEE